MPHDLGHRPREGEAPAEPLVRESFLALDLVRESFLAPARGYPLTNAIFEDTRTAVLYQNGRHEMVADISKVPQLADLLNALL